MMDVLISWCLIRSVCLDWIKILGLEIKIASTDLGLKCLLMHIII